MDHDRFDHLTKRIAGRSRRWVLTGVLASAVVGWLGRPEIVQGKPKPCKGKASNGKPCRGCCNRFGDCVRNVDETACGKHGSPCKRCSDGVRCHPHFGLCACDKRSCFGCCTSVGKGKDRREVCRNGNSLGACGRNGEDCIPCPPGEECPFGQCRIKCQGDKPKRCEGCGTFSCCSLNENCCCGFCCS